MKKVIFGNHEDNTLRQFDNCLSHGNVAGGVLCADGHYGYSQPVGGVVAYKNQISPSGVGFDIGCGNKAIKTDLKFHDIKNSIPLIMDDIQRAIPFGVGESIGIHKNHAIFEDPLWDVFLNIGQHEHDDLISTARSQLGTAGAGNHYIDILVDEKTDDVWIGNHFGSRGFGHKTATGFMNIALNNKFSDTLPNQSMEAAPLLFDLPSEVGTMYFDAMTLAGKYAQAGRNLTLEKVLNILGGKSLLEVHNHHNYAWKETHFGKEYVVVRKGATPAFPGQLGFVGGSMGDISVILQGIDSEKSRDAFFSTIHGAGRIMSRTQAAGRMNWKTKERRGGLVTQKQMDQALKNYGVELRGGGLDESPFVYRKLRDVLQAHEGTIDIVNVLKPVGVSMA